MELFAALLITATSTAGVCAFEPVEDRVYNAACWVDSADCPDVGRCDLAPAIGRIQTNALANGHDVDGPLIQIPSGEWNLGETIYVGTHQEIAGRGEGRTRVYTSTTAFFTLYRTRAEAEGRGRGGILTLRDLSLVESITSSTTYTAAVWAEGRVHIERVDIRGFVHGVRIDADVKRPGLKQSNANTSRLRDVTFTFTRHAAIYLQGGDVNASYSIGVSSIHACYDPEPWFDKFGDPGGTCRALLDSSFLGSTHFAPHIASTRDVVDGVSYRHYAVEGSGARTTFVGAYGEDTVAGIGDLGPQTVVIGGIGASKWYGDGFVLDGPRANRLLLRNDVDPANVVELLLGNATNTPGAIMAMRADAGQPSKRLTLKYENTWREAWRWDVAGANSAVPFRIGATTTSPLTLGGFQVGKAAP